MRELPEVLYAELMTVADTVAPSLVRALQRDCRTDGACVQASEDNEYRYYTVRKSIPSVPSAPNQHACYRYRMTDPRRYAHQIRTGEILLTLGKQCYALVPHRETDTNDRVVRIVFW